MKENYMLIGLAHQSGKLLFIGLNVPGIDVHQSCPPCVKGGRGDWAAGTDDLQPTSANSQGTIVTVCTDSPNLFSHVSDYCTIPQSASLTAPFTQGSHERSRASASNNNLAEPSRYAQKCIFLGGKIMRIVVKIGTSTLTHATGHLNIRRVASLCQVISDIKNAGHEVILVSSGAIGMGVGKLGLRQRPKDIPTKQAAAAVGQCELMYTYDKLFSDYHHTVAQLLITGEDVASETRHRNFSNTLNRLLELGALPIINENDTVATEEIVIGDNDTLAAIVAKSVNAQLLVLLSDIDGLYTADPRKNPEAKLIPTVTCLDDSIKALAGVSGSDQGTGGMITKLQAAEICMGCGCDMVIANGNEPNNLYTIMDGGAVGTRFKA